jgi:hypothetical protein
MLDKRPSGREPPQELNVVAMVKGDEQYVFVYTDDFQTATLRLLGRFAADPDLSLNWDDAAALSTKIRERGIIPNVESKSEPSEPTDDGDFKEGQ